MSDKLYFLPIIAKALSEPNTKVSLMNAFEQIQRLSIQKRYQHGFDNFKKFMAESCSYHETLNDDHVRQFMLEIASPTNELPSLEKKMLVEAIGSFDGHGKEFDEIEQMIRRSTGKRCPVIELFCDRKRIGMMKLTKQTPRQSIGEIVPGEYILKFDTGWILWQERLTEEDLFWKKAFGKENLELAADSGQTSPEPVRQILLLDGRIIVRVFAGIESGMIEVQRRETHGN